MSVERGTSILDETDRTMTTATSKDNTVTNVVAHFIDVITLDDDNGSAGMEKEQLMHLGTASVKQEVVESPVDLSQQMAVSNDWAGSRNTAGDVSSTAGDDSKQDDADGSTPMDLSFSAMARPLNCSTPVTEVSATATSAGTGPIAHNVVGSTALNRVQSISATNGAPARPATLQQTQPSNIQRNTRWHNRGRARGHFSGRTRRPYAPRGRQNNRGRGRGRGRYPLSESEAQLANIGRTILMIADRWPRHM